MNDTEPNFGPFAPQPMFEEPKPNGRKTPKKKGRPKKIEAAPAAVPVSVRRPRKARAVKIDLATAMWAFTGLTEDDGKFLTGVIQSMQAFSAARKRAITAALGKLFDS